MRSGVVLLEGDRVALIERVRDGRTYYVFPGGGVEPGETAEAAAAREAFEELGVTVTVGALLAQIDYDSTTQLYFDARVTGGKWGTGEGKELQSPADSKKGSYQPVWIPLAWLRSLDVRPPEIVELLAADSR